jgi:hypothetical protein
MTGRFRAASPRRRLTLVLTTVLAGLIGTFVLATAGSAHTMLPSSVSSAASTLASEPNQINFTLEGCRNNGTITLPNGSGQFVCPDSAYTTGNLGKGWNELDLVPHRVTLKNNNGTQTYAFLVAGDYTHAAGDAPDKLGWDFISPLTLNSAHSSGCTASVTSDPVTITPSGSGAGGADQTIYRLITITNQPSGSTCAYDYYQRLALGSHNFSGSSLQSNLWNQSLGSQGIGEKKLSIPVNEILPQSINKDMSASQGSDHTWGIVKTAPATASFGNTCDPSGRSKPLNITVTWTKSEASPSGDVTITTHVYATNPAARIVTVNVSDTIYQGLSGTTAEVPTSGTNPGVSGDIDVSPNSTQLILTHTITVASGDGPDFNDVATATYKDKATGVPVPGNTTATASASVQSSGSETNQTATINDTEQLGSGSSSDISYSTDSFQGATGAFDNGYVAGTSTQGSVSWTSGTESAGGSVTFSKTITIAGPSQGSGSLDDTATVNGSDGFSASASKSVAIQADARVTLTINKSISSSLSNDQTFSFDVSGPDGYSNTVGVTVPHGSTSGHTDVSNLEPGNYTVTEDQPASGWAYDPLNPPQQSANIALPTCSGSVSFSNSFAPASARALKTTVPSGAQAGWHMTISDGTNSQSVDTDSSGEADFTMALVDGKAYTITEDTASLPGYDKTGQSGDCSFTVHYLADAGRLFTCSFQNTLRGSVKVVKTENGAPPSVQYTFVLTGGTDNVNISRTTRVNDVPLNSGNLFFTPPLLKPGSYTLCETGVGAGTTPSLFSAPNITNPRITGALGDTYCVDFTLAAGENRVFNVNNSHPLGGQRTIGYWKNWNTCANSKGNQTTNAQKTGNRLLDQFIPLVLVPSTASPAYNGVTVATCQKGVEILSNSSSKFSEHNLAAQLLAALLNKAAAGGQACPAANTAIGTARSLLQQIKWDGSATSTLVGSNHPLRSQFDSTAATLDKFNNEKLC